MRIKSIFILLMLLFISLFIVSCDNPSNDSDDIIIAPREKVTISFNSNGDSDIQDIVQTVNHSYELPVPTKLGYTFEGWYYGDELIKANGIWTINTNIELLAKWTANKYSINYITIGGINTNPITYTVEDELILKPLEWSSNEDNTAEYVFAGWYEDAEFKKPIEKIEQGMTGNIDVYAKWNALNIPEEKTKTQVTIRADGYECDGEIRTFTVGDNYNLPNLEKDGYIFNGWKSEDDSIYFQSSGVWTDSGSELVLIPNWTKRAYSITYVLNESVNNINNPETFYITDTVILHTPTKEKCYFAGWYTDEKYENPISKIDEGTKTDITVFAKWLNIYTITYNSNGGNITENQQEVIFDKEYSLITPNKIGYSFDGWYYNDVLISQNGVWNIIEDINLEAKWSIIPYTITYDLNGGFSNSGEFPSSYDITTDKLQIGIPKRNGYRFIGWQYNSEIEYYHIINKGSSGNISLKAMWYKIDYTYQDNYGLQYLLKDDNTLSVVGYVGEAGNISIPYTYNGYKITEIGQYAFCGYGDELSKLSSRDFYRCDIPDTVNKIGKGAFIACDDLKVQLANDSTIPVEEWSENLIIEEDNEHVLDVIQGESWKKYWKP
ncbi:MAG: InlB B-repeat-containing protein [Clostridia bacterium]|nr:InlB B-repeat-containing protein [Clostridia bacterium]